MKVFHHDDNDGRGAAAIVAQLTGDRNPNNYIEMDYTKPLPVDKVSDNERVWIVDLSISTEENVKALRDLIKKGCDVIWIDHHESSFETLKKYPELNSIKGIRSVDRCGAYLTHRFCFGTSDKNMPEYLVILDDQDRHGSQDYVFGEKTAFFRLAVQSVPNGPLDEVWSQLKANPISALHNLLERGKIIKNYKSLADEFYRKKHGYESTFEGMDCFVVNNKADGDIFGDLINRYPLLITWVYNGSKYVYTLYSRYKDINCAKIASKYGGGGHPGAAGFSSDKLLLLGQEE